MEEFIWENMRHVLFVLLLISRLSDIGTTYLATPRLVLEANPVAKWLGWKFAVAGLILCLLPYYHTGVAVAFLVMSLLVSSSNASGIWMARAMGEQEYRDQLLALARKSRLWQPLAGTAASGGFIIVAAVVLGFLCPDYWGYHFALGLGLYGAARLLHRGVFFWRLFRRSRQQTDSVGPADGDESPSESLG